MRKECDYCDPPIISYLHSATFENGDFQVEYMYMHSLHIGDSGPVEAILIVSMDLKVRQRCCIAGGRHQVGAVAHEVVLPFVKGGVVGIT